MNRKLFHRISKLQVVATVARAAAATVVIVAVATVAWAASMVRLEDRPGSHVKVEGTSTLHAWHVESKSVDGAIEIEEAFLTDPSLASVASLHAGPSPKVTLTIAVAELASGNDRMDRLMREALLASKHPSIRFAAKEIQLPKGTVGSGKFNLQARGDLSIAGTTKEVAFPVEVERAADGKTTVAGKVPLKMTQFGIKPPVAMLGTLKTGDDITVSFRWVVAPNR